MAFDAGIDMMDYISHQVMGSRYHRIDPVLREPIGVDAIYKLKDLVQAGVTYPLAPSYHWMFELFNYPHGTAVLMEDAS
jgi:hypothetical protein